MKRRRLSATDITLSEVGFGAWGIGGATPGATSYGPTDDAESLHALERAFALGIDFFDTSSVYGYGHSEVLLARAFARRRSAVTIATKAGLAEYGRPADFSPKALRASLEASLARLGSDYVDVFQLHNPARDVMARPDDVLALVAALRAEGRIRAFGVSVRAPEDGLLAIDVYQPDAVQTNFNLMDQRALDCGLLEVAARARVSVIARTPLAFGFLANDGGKLGSFDPRDHRSTWPADQIERWRTASDRLAGCMAEAQPRAVFALRYCLSFDAVASTIPGMLRAEEVDANAAASGRGRLSAAELHEVARVYKDSDVFGPRPSADPGKLDASPTRAPRT